MSKIAIISDTHDQIANLRAAISHCNTESVDLIIHCGDLISPFMLKELAKFNGPTHLIYGNNAGDQHLISSRCSNEYANITHHGIFGRITVCGLKVAFVHYPDMAMGLVRQKEYDIVCCGHNHRNYIEQYEETLLINPGHMLGENESGGFTVLDCTTMSVQRISVGECMFNREVRVESNGPARHLHPTLNR
ncbi:YfcE family phosphodiesterase [Desulfosediminicola flagellatus]|uniref:YfcE family phosphodiesterase n=1 Tax=Desulfosediminicola flagellatus TaxID=2569541 RepID=UPI0010AD6C20|nr:YfcE family phosphodiesterase [Desulfosediminicola flagellatus]